MDPVEHWNRIKQVCRDAFGSSFHYSLASVSADGSPHVTPIGSLILTSPGRAIYFEEFTRGMPANFAHSDKVCVLAVNSGLWFWLTALIRGRFAAPPALRLHGTVGAPRPASARERELWLKRVRRMRRTRGHALIWEGMGTVRDLSFSRVDDIHIGPMTRGVGLGSDVARRRGA